MKKYIFTIIALTFIGVQLNAQELINQVNSNGERIGKWKKYYKNKRIRYEGQFENGKEVGVFKFYSASSSDYPIVIKTFNNGEASVQFFTELGVIESEGKMIDKERIGTWLYYHKDGKSLMVEENYINGKLSGESKVFYPNGKLTKIVHYENGILNGNMKRFSEDSIIIEDVTYTDGELHGEAIFYDKEGNVKEKGVYEHDLKVGFWEYYSGGELTKSTEIKNIPTD
ncbi:toxin-antitoxin system YwqK family antitoxin [Urechidicola croceus]|uniref:Preprotein translocase YidC n=1 Tax=Urechidicola croceus TaxID=1850246 RepID=A0A1D8P629_9FLAO|nr:hypothetical protein [Urechidicola croceus]AOW19997.1 hypothetical protein LPB138_04555 [Urechidicola croceus]